jgi:hypothetical protein
MQLQCPVVKVCSLDIWCRVQHLTAIASKRSMFRYRQTLVFNNIGFASVVT